MNKFFILIATFWSCSCNNVSDSANETTGETVHGNSKDTIVTSAKPVMVAGCYQMISKNDTANLELTVSDSLVKGKLNYRWYEKDNNIGTIKGVIRDSIIIADYSFESEGMLSNREIMFKIYPEKLVQGTGAMEEKNGKQVWKDHNIQFDSGLNFYKTSCR